MKLYQEFFYLIVGYTKQTVDNFKEQIKKLVEKGKLSEQEGKDIIDDFVKKTEEKSKLLEQKMSDFIKDTMEKFNFAHEKDINEVKERLLKIEEKIANLK